jgi:hypothetical protein
MDAVGEVCVYDDVTQLSPTMSRGLCPKTSTNGVLK